MGNMAEARRKMHERDERVKKENKSEVKKIRARRKMHERDERVKKENKSEVKKIRNFFFGCCNDKESGKKGKQV